MVESRITVIASSLVRRFSVDPPPGGVDEVLAWDESTEAWDTVLHVSGLKAFPGGAWFWTSRSGGMDVPARFEYWRPTFRDPRAEP